MRKILVSIFIVSNFYNTFSQDTTSHNKNNSLLNKDKKPARATISAAKHNISSTLRYPPSFILFILNGMRITDSESTKLNPDDISDITIYQDGDSAAIKKYGEKAKYGTVEISLKKDAIEREFKKIFSVRQQAIPVDSSEKSIFRKVEIEPYCKGGFKRFVSDNLVSKTDEKGSRLTGVVRLKFIVHINGTITDIVVDKRSLSSNEILIKEATRLIKLTDGNWAGGEQNGRMLEQCFHYEDIIFK